MRGSPQSCQQAVHTLGGVFHTVHHFIHKTMWRRGLGARRGPGYGRARRERGTGLRSCRSPTLPSSASDPVRQRGRRMSVTEQSGGAFGAEPWDPDYDGGSFSAAGPSGGYSDRMPPQDNDAEQSVIGSMLLSKDAIADV